MAIATIVLRVIKPRFFMLGWYAARFDPYKIDSVSSGSAADWRIYFTPLSGFHEPCNLRT
jgi:hypothetical protein